MESTIKHPFKATTLPLKELCHDFYQYWNSRNRHQIDKPKNNRSKHLKKVFVTQQIQKKLRMGKNGIGIASFWKLVSLLVFQSSLLVSVAFCIIAWEIYLLDRKFFVFSFTLALLTKWSRQPLHNVASLTLTAGRCVDTIKLHVPVIKMGNLKPPALFLFDRSLLRLQ